MLEALLIYALCCYLVYHVLARSDLLAKPRAWAFRSLSGWLTYPLTCALCATWWLGVAGSVVGFISAPFWMLLAAPVVNMVLDLIVRLLIRANEPPVMGEGSTGISTWRAPSVFVGTAATSVSAGQMVQVAHGDGVQIPESMRYAHWPTNERAPDGWEQVNRDSSLYRTSGLIRWWPGKLVGRKVRVVMGPRAGATGTIDNGEGPAVFVSGANITPWTYFVKPDMPLVRRAEDPSDGRIKVLARDCVVIDDTPFNPLDHEQTK